MICPSCKDFLIWGGDHSYEDYGMDGEGIVGNYTCKNTNCEVTDIFIYTKIDDRTKGQKNEEV